MPGRGLPINDSFSVAHLTRCCDNCHHVLFPSCLIIAHTMGWTRSVILAPVAPSKSILSSHKGGVASRLSFVSLSQSLWTDGSRATSTINSYFNVFSFALIAFIPIICVVVSIAFLSCYISPFVFKLIHRQRNIWMSCSKKITFCAKCVVPSQWGLLSLVSNSDVYFKAVSRQSRLNGRFTRKAFI